MPAARLAVAAARRRAAAAAKRRAAAAAAREARPFAVRPTPQLALPAPPKPLALPAPGPGLPPGASKPRGGQFWTGKADAAVSPDDVARQQASDLSYRFMDFVPEDEGVVRMGAPVANEVQDWLARSLAKYYKTDFGSPEDPLRELAARGLHYDPDMTPEKWKATVDSYLLEDPIQSILFPSNPAGGMPGAGSDLRGETLAAMPWLAKQPVTDKLYGISGGGLDIAHFADEFANALNPEVSGLPMDLAVRRDSLGRMTFPQAVERVGRINQFRAKQMEEAAARVLDNPAIQTFKEYPDAGYRWVELRAPDEIDLPENFDILGSDDLGYDVMGPDGTHYGYAKSREEAISKARKEYARDPLQQALKYEGDTMGHCVGGYCDDVASGRSRIFSLRDAKGEPHVTIETTPRRVPQSAGLIYRVPDDVSDELFEQAGGDEAIADRLAAQWFAANPQPDDIIQIKGKQNRAPKDDYLPFVQDFVKSGTWGNIGDLGNTGLVKLPDGRYITQQQYNEGMTKAFGENAPELLSNKRLYGPDWFERNWADAAPHFEGYAIGGRVSRDRCFSRSPMSVR